MNDYDPSSDFDFPAPSIDPHSPARQKAMKYSQKAKICFAVTIVGFVLLLLAVFTVKNSAPWAIFLFLPFLGIMALGFHCKKQERMLRCTKRTTAVCVNTVLHSTGRTPSRHPVVEYEVDGATMTAELSVTCKKDAVGHLYTVYYDPLDPATVRTE